MGEAKSAHGRHPPRHLMSVHILGNRLRSLKVPLRSPNSSSAKCVQYLFACLAMAKCLSHCTAAFTFFEEGYVEVAHFTYVECPNRHHVEAVPVLFDLWSPITHYSLL